jgi:hypothetical protein
MTRPTLKPKIYDAVKGGGQPSIATAAVMGNAGVLNRMTRSLTSSKGKTVDTPLEDAYAVNLFLEMPEKNNNFVSSIQADIRKGKKLSQDQLVWVHHYAIGWLTEKTHTSQEVGSSILIKIAEMLEAASINLKYPKIRLASSDGQVITLSKSSDDSRYPNTIGVFAAERNCFGRIENLPNSDSAVFRKSKICPDWVEESILHFAGNPVEGAKTFAKLTGNCCFCNTALTDKKSVGEGYGPICARRYNLPWGNERR